MREIVSPLSSILSPFGQRRFGQQVPQAVFEAGRPGTLLDCTSTQSIVAAVPEQPFEQGVATGSIFNFTQTET